MKKLKIKLYNIDFSSSVKIIKKFNILLDDFNCGDYIGYNEINYKDCSNILELNYSFDENYDMCRLYMFRYIEYNFDIKFEIIDK